MAETSPKQFRVDSTPESLENQKLGRSKSWDRAVIYDLEDGSINIERKRDVEKRIEDRTCNYKTVNLPKRKKNISLVIDKDYEIKLESGQRSSDNRFLARLSFDNLGPLDRLLFFLGYVSTLYVSVASHTSATS